MRYLWLGLGWSCVGLAMVGTTMPVLPTVPFLLVAVWAFSKGSPEAREWLFRHPKYGPMLQGWCEQGAVPRTAKIASAVAMAVSFVIIVLVTNFPVWVLVLKGMLFVAIAVFVATRPEPIPQPRTID
ncbi:MAG: DUF454 domain-containing protein [Geminicoccaceae bacterium]|nr:MAG: DUF454 domain-containing protein [Geminicoccaceae bacterium]